MDKLEKTINRWNEETEIIYEWEHWELTELIDLLMDDRKRLTRIEKITRIIFHVVSNGLKGELCPHGNNSSYPTSGWWCDECWWELEKALGE